MKVVLKIVKNQKSKIFCYIFAKKMKKCCDVIEKYLSLHRLNQLLS